MISSELNNKNDNFDLYRERLTKFSSEFELGLFLYITRRSLIWVVLLLTVTLTVAYLYLRYAQPVYASKSTVQISNKNQASKVLSMSQAYEEQNSLAEAIEILRSKVFLKRVVNKLDLYVGYYNEGTFKSNELYLSTPFIAQVNFKKSDFYNKKFYVTFSGLKKGKIELKDKNEKNNITIPFTVDEWVNNEGFDIRISHNPTISAQEAFSNSTDFGKMYFIKFDENHVVSEIQSRLEIRLQSELAKTVGISIRDYNPAKAADIVNTIAEEFQQYDIERESKSAENVLSFINGQLDHVFQQLKRSEDTLENFRKDKNYNTNEERIKADMAKFSSIEDQVLRTELEERILENIQDDIKQNKSVDAYQLISTVNGTQDEASVKELVSTLQKLLMEKENLLFQVTANSIEVKRVNNQIENQKNLLISTINSLRIKMKGKLVDLKNKSGEYEGKYANRPENDLEYARLLRFFGINEKYYTLLLEKKTEFSISKAGFVSQTMVLERGIANLTPVSPNQRTTILIAVLTALVMGLFIIISKYLFHNEINSLNEITKQTHAGVSILGIVPKYDREIPISQLVVDKNPKSLIAEAFRSLRTNLQFISNEQGTKVVALTSTISGEGKTFVAINLAGIIAYSGKKVIILDLDMRKPKIHKGFGTTNEKGMSTILINKHGIAECVNRSNLPDLDFITAGPIPPNPSELIISPRMDEVLAELKAKYDIIVIDNPPIGLVTDGISMISKADYPIYVFR
ncbi:MAG TPA: polysaccharide biosynthesis tyrosine autokinase, partial [Bacteroidia bacterium]|nr:polysaccharide biosynthesis tyrosine autokinase [Bacteroidia bacterium]